MTTVRKIFEAYDWADVIFILDNHNPPDGYLTKIAHIECLTKGYSVEIIDEQVAPTAHHDSDT